VAKLTAKQRLFVAEYLIDGNATRAAVAAGYSEETARSIGSENLTKPAVAAEIERRLQKRLEKLEISGDRVLRELALMGFARMDSYIAITDAGEAYVDLSAIKSNPDLAAAVQEVTVDEYTEGRGDQAREVKRVKFKLSDKRGSLELLGKHLKLWTDKTEHVGASGGPIRVQVEHIGGKFQPPVSPQDQVPAETE
jgi:phage terminase small subunit